MDKKYFKLILFLRLIICIAFLFMGDYSTILCDRNNITVTHIIAFTAYVGVSLLIGVLIGRKYNQIQELKELKELEELQKAALAQEELLKAEELLKIQEKLNSEINNQIFNLNDWEFFGSC